METIGFETEMVPGELPTGTVTFLLADVEGSSRLWEADADGAAASMDRLRALTAEMVSAHGGVCPEEQGEGDSFVAAFSRASDALATALDLQLVLAREVWPGPPLALRMGLHAGEARLRDEGRNYAGQTVNRCARLRSLGHGGQTLLSQATYELVVERPPAGASLKDLGPHRLRDLQRPERVWQLCHPELRDGFPPLRSLEVMPNNLPAQLTTFVGREEEIAEVRKLLTENRIVTLTGSGGVGKTRLAVEAGAALLDDYPDGVWWVDLSSISAGDVVPKAVAQTASIAESPTRPPTDVLLSELRDAAVLIVLDNCEHLTQACADLAEHLVRGCSLVAILATSREPLGIAGEVPWRVPSLRVPGSDEPVEESDAVRLFRERAVSSRPNFRITADNAEQVAEICRQLEGIPLAIELAAARVRVLTPKQIAAGLSDRFHLLTGGGPRALPRQRTLEASVDWSYNLLSDEERKLLRRLSVFAGGLTLDAAEAVCSGDDLEPYRVLDLLTALVDRSLTQMDDDEELARYRLLETIRQYAAQRLVDAGEGPALGDRHLAHYVQLTEDLHVETDQSGEAIAALEAERDNLRAALDWAVRGGHTDLALRLVTALQPFWTVQGHETEGDHHMDAALAMEQGHPLLRARALAASLITASNTRFGTVALERGEEALALARELGDRWVEVRALIGIGRNNALMNPRQAREAIEEAIPLAQELQDDYAAWWTNFWLGWLQFQAGEVDGARSSIEAAHAISTGTGVGRAGRSMTLAWLGSLELYAGNLGAAERLLEEVVAIGRAGSVGPYSPGFLGSLALVALTRGDRPRAEALFDEMEDLERRRNEPDIYNFGLYAQIAKAVHGDKAGALRGIEASLNVMRAVQFNWMASMTSAFLAFGALTDGRREDVRRHLDEATTLATKGGVPYGVALAAYVAGLRAVFDKEFGEAEEHFHDALTTSIGCNFNMLATLAIEELAALAAIDGAFEMGTRLFGFADGTRKKQGWVGRGWFFIFIDDDSLDTTSEPIEAARSALGDDAFDAACQQGSEMSLDEAVAYVQRGRGPRKRPSAGWSSLSPRELEVARLVAHGLTNPEIGEKLFLSKRTVQTHLSHIFAKVGVASRAELASEATRREG